MAASDARPVPRKNAAWRMYFAIRNSSGALITSWTGADSEISKDGAAFADCTDEATETGTSGCGYLDFTASEMNADAVTIKITVTNSGALPIVQVVYPEEAGDYRADVTHFGGTAGTFASGIPEVKVASMATNSLTAAAIAADAGAELAALVETYIVNEGDATAVLQAVASAVWSAATRTITGGSLTTSPPTAAAIADAVWDELRTGHTTAGTFGFYLDAAISGISGGGGGSGTGARTVTINVNDGTTVLQNARVRLTEGANTFTALTNASGVATLNVDDATYTVAITKSGYSYAGTTLVVDDDKVRTYSMTVVTITPGGDAGEVTGYFTVRDEVNNAESGVTIYCRMLGVDDSSTGDAHDGANRTEVSAGNGLVQFEGLLIGATYEFWRTAYSAARKVTIPDTTETQGGTYALPDIIGGN